MNIDFIDCPEIKDKLTDEERSVYDGVFTALKSSNTVITKALNTAFAIILLYACFTLLPLWAAASLIGIKLAIHTVNAICVISAIKKLRKKYKNFDKILVSIRYKISQLN